LGQFFYRFQLIFLAFIVYLQLLYRFPVYLPRSTCPKRDFIDAFFNIGFKRTSEEKLSC
jgi:hypothetical protein